MAIGDGSTAARHTTHDTRPTTFSFRTDKTLTEAPHSNIGFVIGAALPPNDCHGDNWTTVSSWSRIALQIPVSIIKEEPVGGNVSL
jgi:hypothetical protein